MPKCKHTVKYKPGQNRAFFGLGPGYRADRSNLAPDRSIYRETHRQTVQAARLQGSIEQDIGHRKTDLRRFAVESALSAGAGRTLACVGPQGHKIAQKPLRTPESLQSSNVRIAQSKAFRYFKLPDAEPGCWRAQLTRFVQPPRWRSSWL